MEERDRYFVGHLDQEPPAGEAPAERPITKSEEKYLILSKYGCAVRFFDLSEPEDVEDLCGYLTSLEQHHSDEPAYLHPEWTVSDKEPRVQCEDCVVDYAAAERDGITPTVEISCAVCGSTASRSGSCGGCRVCAGRVGA